MSNFFYGVIEGFYGRQWSWKDREKYAFFLAEHAFDCYIYAPKGDPYLRSQWREPYSPSNTLRLANLRSHYHDKGLRWGLGLSPLGLSHSYTAEDSRQLQRKIRAINSIEPDILCILFDDIRGDISDLALRQLDIVEDILSVSRAKQHILCPTYYSFDPVLEKVFGKMPEYYLESLGQGLAANIDIFWTGEQVISQHYTHNNLETVTRLFNRRPILWDNYPVNDGRDSCNYLHLKPYTGRPYQLKNWSSGHVVNPMNQPYLSQLVLQSLQKLYQLSDSYDVELAFDSGLDRFASKGLGKKIKEDLSLFQKEGLSRLSLSQRDSIRERYKHFDEPLAQEIMEWLAGAYQFDPQCLTE